MHQYKSNATLCINKATEFIAHYAPIESNVDRKNPRDHKDRIRKRIEYSLKNGKLEGTASEIVFANLIVWAREIWPANFNTFPIVHYASGITTIEIDESASAVTFNLPDDIKACHKIIITLSIQIEDKDIEIERLRPFEEKYKRLYQIKNDAGKKGGRGKTK